MPKSDKLSELEWELEKVRASLRMFQEEERRLLVELEEEKSDGSDDRTGP